MSSSRLNPSVTPVTALATRLRARPWNFAIDESSTVGRATRCPSDTSKRIPGGTAWRSLPLGPWTSTAASSTCTDTPLGNALGFLPIRDMAAHSVPGRRPARSPDVAEHLAADAGLHRLAPRHHAAGSGEDARAESSQHLRQLVAPEVDAAARAGDPLDPGDQAFAVRPVLEEQPQGPRRARGAAPVEELEPLDVALVLQNPGDLGLQPRRGDVDA